MAVYVDQAIWAWQGLKWCHLLADDLDDLHRFAASLGIKRTSYQAAPKSSVPHYDLTAYERKQAIARGAVPCTRAEIVIIARRFRSRAPRPTRVRSGGGARGKGLEHVLTNTSGPDVAHNAFLISAD